MKCNKCGIENMQMSDYCYNCGAKMEYEFEENNIASEQKDDRDILVNCESCGKEQLSINMFCKNCGFKMKDNNSAEDIKCRKCGMETSEKDRFCLNCGAKSDKPRTRSLHLKIFAAIITVCIILAAGLFFIYNPLKEKQMKADLKQAEEEIEEQLISKSLLEENQVIVETNVQEGISDDDSYENDNNVVEDIKGVWEITTSSYLIPNNANNGPYGTLQIYDDDLSTCWIPGNARNGIGEKIIFKLKNGDKAKIKSFGIFGGYGKSNQAYFCNLRVKDITIFIDEEYSVNYSFKDEQKYQYIRLLDEIVASTIVIEINSVYPSSNYGGNRAWNDLCVSEVLVDSTIAQ